MSDSLVNSAHPHLAQVVPGGSSSAADRVYQISAVCAANSATIGSRYLRSMIGVRQFLHSKAIMGTPQMRWREMHQSGRVAIMLEIRSSPQEGIHLTLRIAS